LNQGHTDIELNTIGDVGKLEDSLKILWDKIRSSTAIISSSRDENKSLADRISNLEKEISSLKTELYTKEQDLKRSKLEHAQLQNTSNTDIFTTEEKENLKTRIREIIAKINSYL
jgi:chromosome segregation ATPase